MSKACGCVVATEIDSTRFMSFTKDVYSLRKVINRKREEVAVAHLIGWCENAKTYRSIHRIRGTYVATVPCDARCAFAKGHDCQCSCGGKNHGAGHVMKLKTTEELVTL